MIRLRDVPGVQGVEDAMRLNRLARVSNDHDLTSRVDQVSLSAFGLTEGQTGFEYPSYVFEKEWDDLTEEEVRRVNEGWDEWHSHFDIGEYSDRITAWAQLGWDITDDSGEPLMCLAHFRKQMICVSKGLRGRSLEDVATDAWATRLNASKRPNVSDEQKARNRAFLQLGVRPRRTRAS